MSQDNIPPTSKHLTDPIMLMNALRPVFEKAGPLLSRINELVSEHLNDKEQPLDPLGLREAWATYMDYALAQPEKTFTRQFALWTEAMSLWQNYMLRVMGEPFVPDRYSPQQGDRRFKSELWTENPYFDFLKQLYLLTGKHILDSVNDFSDIDEETRKRLDFALRQYISAISPTNFLLTNPEAIKATLDSGGENLIHGLENLIRDLERGKGELRISMTDYEAFKLGKNIASTEGVVIYKNEIMELIQYKATTDKVQKEPLLIIPPWINKYYILDLQPQNSFIKWLVDQGHTVFIISWVNPNEKLAHLKFEDYMHKGVLEALDEVQKTTKAQDINTIGYCIGGTLLSMTLAWLEEKKQNHPIKTATFLTTLINFEEAGELKLFTTPAQIDVIEAQMKHSKGLLPSQILKTTFSLLRANDLIWNFVINNYLIGKDPFPFDLLYWNDDSTNLPAPMHSYYLKNMYRDNKLKDPGGLEFGGVKLDLGKIKTPAYFLATQEDHIAPWAGCYMSMQLFKSEKQFTLAGSGHIAGVVNPPAKNKYGYYASTKTPDNRADYLQDAKWNDGSWWPHWQEWISAKNSKEKIKAPTLPKGLEKAPGSYVKKK